MTTCLHGENGLIHGVIPFPIMEASIKVEGLPSPYYLSVSSEEMGVMNLAIGRTVQVNISKLNDCRMEKEIQMENQIIEATSLDEVKIT